MSTQVSEAPARRVRVTFEGDARPLVHHEGMLRVDYASGARTVIVDAAALDVLVEDIAPPRTWTDGDVLEAPGGLVYVRSGELWRGHNSSGVELGPHDDESTTREVDRAFLTVVRYQAGEQ